MKFDKIVHYLGKTLVDHIGSLDETQLKTQRDKLIADLEILKQIYIECDILRLRRIELMYINYRLGEAMEY